MVARNESIIIDGSVESIIIDGRPYYYDSRSTYSDPFLDDEIDLDESSDGTDGTSEDTDSDEPTDSGTGGTPVADNEVDDSSDIDIWDRLVGDVDVDSETDLEPTPGDTGIDVWGTSTIIFDPDPYNTTDREDPFADPFTTGSHIDTDENLTNENPEDGLIDFIPPPPEDEEPPEDGIWVRDHTLSGPFVMPLEDEDQVEAEPELRDLSTAGVPLEFPDPDDGFAEAPTADTPQDDVSPIPGVSSTDYFLSKIVLRGRFPYTLNLGTLGSELKTISQTDVGTTTEGLKREVMSIIGTSPGMRLAASELTPGSKEPKEDRHGEVTLNGDQIRDKLEDLSDKLGGHYTYRGVFHTHPNDTGFSMDQDVTGLLESDGVTGEIYVMENSKGITWVAIRQPNPDRDYVGLPSPMPTHVSVAQLAYVLSRTDPGHGAVYLGNDLMKDLTIVAANPMNLGRKFRNKLDAMYPVPRP